MGFLLWVTIVLVPLRTLRHALRLAHSVIRERLKGARRSPKWDEVRDRFLAANPTCAACGGKRHMQVHHKTPFHLDPRLELDEANLIGLCMGPHDCHLTVGHGGSFKTYNPDVVASAAALLHHPGRREAVESLARTRRLPG
jgi:hypothetical protein